MKMHLRRTPLAIAIGVLACLAIPSVAQAHHVNDEVSCVLVNNKPTLSVTSHFVDFNSTHDVYGTVWVNNTVVLDDDHKAPISWNGDNGTWTYSKAATAGVAYTVKTAWHWSGGHGGDTYKSDKCPKPKTPKIALDKTGADTAEAGSTFTYSFKATNTGDVTLTNVVLTDDKCQSTLKRVEPNLSDTTFNPGDEWFYTCTVIAPPGPAQVDNIAEVCGDYTPPPHGDKETVCDENPHTFTVPPPPTPPTPPTPPVTPPATPPSSTPTPPDSGVLPETIVSGRAALRGPSGCVKTAFRARVRGRSISSVTFFVDGRRVKQVNGKRAVYRVKVRPGRFGFGRHKVIALVQFTESSGTPARRLPLTFRRCAQGTVAPRFTG